ncbi:MAG: TRAP transporter substrate-binding protein [Pseudomonadota bacterium]
MRKGTTVSFIVAIFIIAVCASARGEDVIKLKSANYLPQPHKMSLLGQKFCDDVNKRLAGKVEITYFAGGTLLTPDKMYTGVTQGITDMGFSHIAYTRGRFPVTEVFEMPLGFPSGYVASMVANDFYNKFKPDEWNNVHVLYFTMSGPLVVQTIKKPVKTLEDMKGLKIRATGALTEVVKALGAAPVPLAMPDVYESLRREVIDGIMVDLSVLRQWRFAEVEKFVTANWQLGTGYTFYFVMNKDKWDKLPPDAQQVFTEVGNEISRLNAAQWNESDIDALNYFKSLGGQLETLSDAEVVKWKQAVEPVIATFKKDMTAKGFSEANVDSWIGFVKERIDFWRQQEKQNGIASPF